MSIAKYIESSKIAIQKAIEVATKSIESHPYPLKELMELKTSEPDSALAKAFDENGRTNVSAYMEQAAAAQDPTLYRKLFSSRKTPSNIKKVKYFKSLTDADIESQLRQRYSNVVVGVAKSNSIGGKLKLDDVIYTERPSDFEEYDDAFNGNLWEELEFIIPMGDADLQSAYKEIYEQRKNSPELQENQNISPLNEEPELEDTNSSSKSTINDIGINKESTASETGTISSTVSEIPIKPEIIEDTTILESNEAPVEKVESISPDIQVERVESKSPDIPVSAPINESKIKAEEKAAKISENMKAYAGMSVNDILNSISTNVSNFTESSSKNEKAYSELTSLYNANTVNEIDESKTTGDSKTNTSINSTNETKKDGAKTNKSTSIFNTESVDFTAQANAAIEELKKTGRITDDDISKAQKKIESAKLENQSNQNELPVKQDTEVSKTTPELANKPIPKSPSVKETNNSTSESKETMQITEVGAAKREDTQSKSEASQVAPAPIVNFDLSQLDNRLSRIEYALSNTLEVKIVE